MYTLSDQQITFILDDIRRNGIETEDLQYNLLDHICCIIEHELEENGDFEHFYSRTIRTFYKGRLAELEEETQTLLTFKHYYTMKNLMLISGLFSGGILSFGILFKFNYWPGASALIAAGIFSLSFIFLPLYFTLKIKEKRETKDKVLAGLTSLTCIGMSLSVLFKVIHWPGANIMGLTSLLVLVLVFLPVYFITGIRNPDTKVNTVVSSVLIIAGSGLFLTLVASPRSIRIRDEFTAENLARNEMILERESWMFKKIKSDDSLSSSKLASEISNLCEELKSKILLNETGCATLTGNGNCKLAIHDALVASYFEGETSLEPLREELQNKIEAYNRQLMKSQQSVPLSAVKVYRNETTIPGFINGLIQTEMFVLQNERQLLASR